MAQLKNRYGYNLVGFISGNFGLAAAARNTARVLDRRRIPMKIVDIDLRDDRSNQELSCNNLGSSSPDPAPFGVNVFHMNPPEIGFAVRSVPAIDPASRLNACVPFWELPALPKTWVPILGAMNFVLTPSEFIHSAITTVLPELPCLPYPQAVIMPEGIKPNRAKFGLPDDGLLFMTAFDMNSDIERKNPWASVRAFQAAFPDPKDEYLVIKVSASAVARVQWASQIQKLTEMAASAKNVILIDEILTYEDVLSLYASSDVFMALHRSEGLGLCLMEAMSLSKPVVATAWSGNMDFTTSENSCLVDFDLVPVPSYHHYDMESLVFAPSWAEARVDHAAAHLVRLRDDAQYRLRLGARASRDMAERRRRFWRGLVWDVAKQQIMDPRSPITVHASRIAQ